MIEYQINEMFWELNERTGIRKIRVLFNKSCIAVFSSTLLKETNTWECQFVPMGFSFSKESIQVLKSVINNSDKIMEMLTQDRLLFCTVQDELNELSEFDEI